MKVRHVLGIRPDIPGDWIVCNAPRPLVGTKVWRGPFVTGVFYAAIAPDDEQKDWMIVRNSSDDAAQLIYHDEAELVAIGWAYYEQKYPDNDLHPDDDKQFLVSTGLDILNGERK